MLGISIIICCYNSSHRLPETIGHIVKQEVAENVLWEVIIVDNASTDSTSDTALKVWSQYVSSAFSFQVVHEKNSGLSHARLKGICEAKYEYLLFCDDDNWLSPSYVAEAFEFMEANPQVGVLGGWSEAVSDVQLPYWFSTYQSAYAVGLQGISSGDISKRGYVWGAGMVFRKSIYLKLVESGFKSLLTGRKGSALSAGEDSEICKWFLLAGYKLWYYEKLHFKHFIPESRLNKDYLLKLQQGFETASVVLELYDYFYRMVKDLSKFKNRIRLKIFLMKLKVYDRLIKIRNLNLSYEPFHSKYLNKNMMVIEDSYKRYNIEKL